MNRHLTLPALLALAAALLTPGSASALTGPPVNAALPAIAGTPNAGGILKAHRGKWGGVRPIGFKYHWMRCDGSGGACAEIGSATQPTYKTTTADIAHTLRLIVDASNGEGGASATSAQTASVVSVKPKKAKLPIVTGSAQDGQLLSTGTGTWKGTAPFTFTYQWLSCVRKSCAAIPGATASSYRVTSAELGKQVRATVTAANASGSASSTSRPTLKVVPGPPVSTAPPAVSGTPVVGQALSAGTGTWAGTGPFTYTYQWQSCPILTGECADIPGANQPSYTVEPLDVASRLQVVVTATNSLGSAAATSPATGAVDAVLPSNVELPTISGLLTDGQLLAAAIGSWTGTAPITYGYQWQLCNAAGEACKDIAEATEAALKLSPGDVGSTLRVVVTATNAAGSTSATSAATSLVAALLPSNTVLPSVTGLLQDGQLLSAVTGTWSGTPPISYAYQWQLCNAAGEACKDVAEATEAALKLSPAEIGSTVRVIVTATNGAGSTSATSPVTGLVGALLPSNTVLPSVTGLLQDGQLLSAVTGTWTGTAPITYGYQWQLCNAAGEACKDIAEATEAALKLSPAEIGSTVRVIVTATNAAGSTSATSPVTALVGALLPSNTVLPSITGVVKDGQLLSAVTGTWTGTAPITYAYQWQLCNASGEACKDIAEATEAALKLSPADVGSTVRVVVKATNAAGTTTATSDASGLIAALLPSNTALPSISGVLKDGQLLSATNGTWTGTPPITYAYQWQSCNASGGGCKDISEAIESTLKLSPSLVGSTVRVVVKATNAAGTTTATSTASGLIAAILPTNTALPSVSGVLKDGQLLSATNGTWTGTPPITYAYQWQSCNAAGEACKDISEAIESTLKLSPALVGSTVRMVVKATNAAGTTTATSTASGLIAALLPSNTALPSVSGVLKDGQVLSAASGTWTGTPPISYGYQWQLCNAAGGACKNISEAVESTFKLSPTEIGSTLRVIVTATNAAGSTAATSAATGLIAALLPSNTALPSTSGIAKDGELLTAATGTWSGTAPITYSHQWQSCNAAGEACKNIAEAVASTLKLSPTDVGSTLRVVVTATNAAGSASATSAATSLVAAIPLVNTALPTISGILKLNQVLTAGTGTWTGTPPTFTYQWQQCTLLKTDCKDIPGATEPKLTLKNLLNLTVRVVVTATNAVGSVTANSPITGVIGL